jgi:peptide/nickel transport system permease protein
MIDSRITTVGTQPEAILREPSGPSRLRGRLRPSRLSRPTILAAALLCLVIFGAVAAPVVAPYDRFDLHPRDRLSGPSFTYLLGTDETGRDLLTLLLYAARISLVVALSAQSLALAMGVPLGLLSGYRGGAVDDLVMHGVNGLLAIPGVLLALTIVGMFGTETRYLVLALAIINTPYVTRIMRMTVLSERGKDYVVAAQAVGATPSRVMFRTILPNCLSPIIVQGSLGIAFAILIEASLSFLGLGVQPPEASWGTLLQVGYSFIRVTPWYVVFPGLFIFVTVWSLNILGDALRDSLDPRLR